MRLQSKEKMSIEYGTSFPENAIAFYLSQFLDLEQNVRLPWLKRSELDIYIESLKIAIEYDGEHFHKTKYQKDMEKDRLCSDNGIELIRIREEGLDNLKGSICFQVNPKKPESLDEVISKVVTYVCDKGGVSSLVVDVDTARDNVAIQNYFIITSKKRSFLEKCPDESKEWNYSKNGNLLPENYAYTSKFKVWWICPKGHEWLAPIYSRAGGMVALIVLIVRFWSDSMILPVKIQTLLLNGIMKRITLKFQSKLCMVPILFIGGNALRVTNGERQYFPE